MELNRLTAPLAFALAAACALGALCCTGCAAGQADEAADAAAGAAESAGNDASQTETPGRTLLLPDWYFNNTSDEDVVEILLNAGCTSAERSGDTFAVTMPEAYAEAFVAGMKGEVQDIVDELAEEAAALGATLEADEDFAALSLAMPSEMFAGDEGSNLALNVKAAAAAAYVYRSAADLGPCEAVVTDESGAELSRATLPDDHEELLSTAEAS